MDELDPADPDAGDSPGIAPGDALRAALEAVAPPAGDLPDIDPIDDSAAVLVRARWVGQPVWNPEQGVIGYGDPIEVTEEQLDDDNTLAVPWADDWSPDPELAAVAAAALGVDADEPEEG